MTLVLVLSLAAAAAAAFFLRPRVENGGGKFGLMTRPIGVGLFQIGAVAALFVIDVMFVHSPMTGFLLATVFVLVLATAYGIGRRADLERAERRGFVVLWLALALCLLSAIWLAAEFYWETV